MRIFVDISADPKKCAIGCYLIIPNLDIELAEIKNSLQTINLTETTSTAAELELINTVLTNTKPQQYPINLYTDCNNFYNLFIKKSYSANHHSAELYAKLLAHIERLNLNVIKIKGPRVAKYFVISAYLRTASCSKMSCKTRFTNINRTTNIFYIG